MSERELARRLGMPVQTFTMWIRTGEVKVKTRKGSRGCEFTPAEVAEIVAMAELRQIPMAFRRARPLMQALRDCLAAGTDPARVFLVLAGSEAFCCHTPTDVLLAVDRWNRRTGPFFVLPLGEMLTARGLVIAEAEAA